MEENRVLDISWGTIIKISLAIVCFYIIYLVRSLIVWFLFAVILSILFDPAIDFLQKRRVPRGLAVLFLYLSVFGITALSLYLIAPVFFIEIQHFSQMFPQYFEKVSPILTGLGIESFENLEIFTALASKTLGDMSANIFGALFSIFGGIISTLFVIVVAAFLSVDEKTIEKTLILLFPKKYQTYALSLWDNCQTKVSGWFAVRVLGCVFVGILSYAAFFLFNIKYPFTLALLSGVLNFVPVVGPLITAIVIFTIVALDSTVKAFFVLVFMVILQQIEGNILTPVLTQRFIGLSPVLVLVALAMGGKLWGVVGAILTIPLFGILFEFLRDFLAQKREEEKSIAP